MHRARQAFDWLFRSRETGRITIAQFPNVAMGVFLVAVFLLRVWDPSGTAHTVLVVVRTAAVLIWAVDEIGRGVNPWRRGLGAIVLVVSLVGLI